MEEGQEQVFRATTAAGVAALTTRYKAKCYIATV